MSLRTRFCRHDWGPWRSGLMSNVAEVAGGSEEAIEAERAMFKGRGLPGIGISAEVDESFEHRICSKCGRTEFRSAPGIL
jgi:hypothetical protein